MSYVTNGDPITIDIPAMRRDRLALFMATPLYGAGFDQFHCSSLSTLTKLGVLGLKASHHHERGMPLVALARNLCAARFLARPEFSHLLFIDSDIEWRPDDALRIWALNQPVTCGVYPHKTPDGSASIPFIRCAGDAPDGLVQISRGATGFMCIRRDVLERIMQERPALRFDARCEALGDANQFTYAFFQDGLDAGSGQWRGEDYWFCDLCRSLGIPMYADKLAVLRHHGARFWEVDPTAALDALAV